MNKITNDDSQIPALIPIKRTTVVKESVENPQKNNIFNKISLQLGEQFADVGSNQNITPGKISKQKKEAIDKASLFQIKEKQKKLHEKDHFVVSIGINDSKKVNESRKSKFEMVEIMNKMKMKNISEELFPVTEEAINKALSKNQKDTEDLKALVREKEENLVTNPHNQHLKKQIEGIIVAINKNVQIQELYLEKLNLRNKIEILEKNIYQLKDTNKELNKRLYDNEESAERHQMGQPCIKQLQLKDQLKRCKEELERQKSQREKLQKNANQTVNSFRRLYDEAQIARQIVVSKLKIIQQYNRKMQLNQNAEQDENQEAKAQNKISKQPLKRKKTLQIKQKMIPTNQKQKKSTFW